MSDIITLTGVVATEPTLITTDQGLLISSFRLASNHRWFDRQKETWIDGDTNWYKVSSFRQLAENVQHSVHKSDRVLVTGRLRLRAWENGERRGTSVEVDAQSIGHDLAMGRSIFTQISRGNAGDGDDHPAGIDVGRGVGDAWPRGGESTAHADRVVTDQGSGGDRRADHTANLQQPFLPEEGSGPYAS